MKINYKLLKAVVLKELKLAISPAVYFFGLLAFCMILIPNYPVWIGAFYGFIAINVSFRYIVSNKDIEYSLSLPIPRNYTVLGKLFNLLFSEAVIILFTIAGAILAVFKIYPLYQSLGITNGGGLGLDANLAFFGILLLAYGVYNLVFLPDFFKTAYKSGKPLLLGMGAFIVVVGVAEILINLVPQVKLALDSEASDTLKYRIITLVIGIIGSIGLNYLAYFLAKRTFSKVNL